MRAIKYLRTLEIRFDRQGRRRSARMLRKVIGWYDSRRIGQAERLWERYPALCWVDLVMWALGYGEYRVPYRRLRKRPFDHMGTCEGSGCDYCGRFGTWREFLKDEEVERCGS